MDCARTLRAARRMRQVSQRELSVLARVPLSTVDRAEAGRVVPRLGTLVQLLGALGYDLVVMDESGERLEPDDEQDKLRDLAGRRLPAHLHAFETPGYFEKDAPYWWGWERVAWPFGPGAPPKYTYYHRPRKR